MIKAVLERELYTALSPISKSTWEVHMATCVASALLFSPSLGGKSEGRRVNIDAHSVPSQPQSIWIHSSLWRTNNLEETLPHSLPPTRPPRCLFVSPLFVFLSVAPLSSHLVKFLPSPSLSSSFPSPYSKIYFAHISCMCSQSQQMNYR